MPTLYGVIEAVTLLFNVSSEKICKNGLSQHIISKIMASCHKKYQAEIRLKMKKKFLNLYLMHTLFSLR